MEVFIVTCGRYFTDGPGGLQKVFATEDAAKKYITDRGGHYDDFDKSFLNEELGLYYYILPMTVEN